MIHYWLKTSGPMFELTQEGKDRIKQRIWNRWGDDRKPLDEMVREIREYFGKQIAVANRVDLMRKQIIPLIDEEAREHFPEEFVEPDPIPIVPGGE